MKQLMLLLVFLFFLNQGDAQVGSVKGVLIDDVSEEALPFAYWIRFHYSIRGSNPAADLAICYLDHFDCSSIS